MSDADEAMRAEGWAGDSGRNWLANLDRFEGMIAPIGEALLAHAAYQPGEHVIDIGCGGGGTTIAIARAVAPGGSATGLDISEDLIRACSVRAAKEKRDDLCFICADAASAIVPGAPFDRLFSRFGSMFFSDAAAGFRNLRGMLKAGGRIDLAVWAPPPDNGWMMAIMGVMAAHVDAPPADPRAPGPFALADTDYARDLLEQAGFGDIAIIPCDRQLPLGGIGATPAEAASFIASSLAIAKSLEDAGEDIRRAVIDGLATAFAPHHRPGEGVMLGGKAWLISSRAI